jgi:hypothetical protein
MILSESELDKIIVKKVSAELLYEISNAPVLEHKGKYIANKLDELFHDVDLSKSFNSPLGIVYDEVLPIEILIHIHEWLRTKCIDIENIILITTHHCGVRAWWKQWCNMHHQKSFSIVELTFKYWDHIKYNNDNYIDPDIAETSLSEYQIAKEKNIHYYFSIYGGTRPNLERMYIILKLLELRDVGVVEYLGEFLSKQDIINYVEHITYFKNQSEVDQLSEIYDRYIIDNRLIKQELCFSTDHVPANDDFFNRYQYNIDKHCFAGIVRETMDFSPYSTITEKTLRAFLHNLAVMPIGYNSVSVLEDQGFWFPHDVIDYSYQTIQDPAQRMSTIVNEIKKMTQQFSIQDLNDYYQQNLHHFYHNTKLVYNFLQTSFIYRNSNTCDT